MRIIPDTSVIVDGQITRLIEKGELTDADILIPEAVIAKLENLANQGKESGITGLNEVIQLHALQQEGKITIHFIGNQPPTSEIDGGIDALIRELVEKTKATLVTSDRVQAHVAKARKLKTYYIQPTNETRRLTLLDYFDKETMSIHLKEGCKPYAKKGKPGELTVTHIDPQPLTRETLSKISREIIEEAKCDRQGFIEIERKGVTVVQLGAMRITIARPPFSDLAEITATRPIVKLTLSDYNPPPKLVNRLTNYHRGILVSGPPGSGKSTFAQAVAEYLYDKGTVVKTIENPRDLQVRDEITQYAPLENNMELTADILLLVRPDFVIYDEVRKSKDFEIFADMRLAGVGLIGVTHANQAIDAIQRLIGRIELGMIPQVVDTVIHIKDGKINQILETAFTVKIPSGMKEADLARPVILITDFNTQKPLFEIYSYGEQVVVMAIGEKNQASDKLAEQQLRYILKKYAKGTVETEISFDRANVYVEESDIPRIIGRGGKTISQIEEEAGIKINVYPLQKQENHVPAIKKSGENILVNVGKQYRGKEIDLIVEGEIFFTGCVSQKGELRIKKKSGIGNIFLDFIASNKTITVREKNRT